MTTSDEEENSAFSGSDVEMDVKIAPRSDRPGRRATSKKINYLGLLDSDEEGGSSNDDGELVFKDNVAVKEEGARVVSRATRDSSDCVIYSGSGSDDSIPHKQPPKQAAKGKRQRKQARISSDSDDDKRVG